LASGSTSAYGVLKQLLYAGSAADLSTHLDVEQAALVTRAMSSDGLEGIDAFLNKREPNYHSRLPESS
jgi:2-(1,2-epoxy-1,2-dihydrophenyl)acetyl-CoA isomerase